MQTDFHVLSSLKRKKKRDRLFVVLPVCLSDLKEQIHIKGSVLREESVSSVQAAWTRLWLSRAYIFKTEE